MANLTNINNKFLVTTGGNVGIGTTSPSQNLEVVGSIYPSGVGSTLLFDTTGALGSNGIKTINDFETLIYNGRGSAGFAVIGNSNIRLGFGTNYTNAETDLFINSSGNATFAGDVIVPNGKISTTGGNNLTISGSVADHAGLIFATNSVLPAVVSAETNNVVDLGQNGNVFKNLYLGSEIISGGGATFAGDIQAPGVYVGSTNTSFDFYNNGTSYFNGAVTIDANLTISRTNAEINFTSGNGYVQTTTGSTSLVFGVNAVEKMRIHSSGNVGIGTTSPASKLDISGGRIGIRNNIVAASNLTYSTIYSTENTGAAYPFTGTSGNLVVEPRNGQDFVVLGTSGVARMVVEGGGNVGIGLTNPSEKLDVNGRVKWVTATGGDIYLFAGSKYYLDGGSNTYIVGESPDGDNIGFVTGGSTAMTIDENQNVGIGNTNPTTKLTVQGVITAGDSTTNAVIRRQHQTFATMKPGPTSGGSVDIMFVDHTHSLDITVVAYINTSNVATGRGYSVSAFGSNTTGLTQTSFSGNVSALSISYVNTGGSESYILRVTTTYSGVTAPSISVTATGQSTSKLRAAT
tara:strand:+ start:1269 stop:2990 length:1722 start_codon:yes stop_codon:yes gene_type:complete